MDKNTTHTLGLEPNAVKERILKIGSQLKERDAKWLWSVYMQIIDKSHPQPCLCPSSARQWSAAMNRIQEWLRENENENDGGE